MKNKKTIIIAVLTVLICLSTLTVTAFDQFEQIIMPDNKVEINQDTVYYAYYNSGSQSGAVAFALDNEFVDYGITEDEISICKKNDDGTYSVIYKISKENVDTWFSGTTEVSVPVGDTLGSLLGGLSGIGFTVDMDKTNVSFLLSQQELTENGEYFIYIPQDYFVDANNDGNAGGYISIEPELINAYTGNLFSDLQMVLADVYDYAVDGVNKLINMIIPTQEA